MKTLSVDIETHSSAILAKSGVYKYAESPDFEILLFGYSVDNSGLFRPRDKPQNSLNSNRYSFFFGGTTSGKPVNENTAMQMTAVYSCVRILSETLAGLPLHVYRYSGDGKEKDLKHPLYRLLHDEPNPEMTSFVFRETLMGHLLLWGNAYAQVIRNARGEVVSLYPLMPNRMTVDRDKNGSLYYMYLRSEGDNSYRTECKALRPLAGLRRNTCA